jgi:hypothetical protein
MSLHEVLALIACYWLVCGLSLWLVSLILS